MLKLILKIIKWYLLFWVFLLAGSIAAAIIAGIFSGLFGLELNIGLLVVGLTVIMMAESILKSRRKKAAKEAKKNAAAAAEVAKQEAARLKNEYAARLDTYREELERLARKVKDRPTAIKIKHIAETLRKIALEVENDPRDRKKVRSLSDHSGAMIVDLVDKYIKLESQNQTSSNIASTMWEIRSALDHVDASLTTLLDDLFSNDVTEVATNIAVLENILNANSPDTRIRMEDIGKSVTEDFAGGNQEVNRNEG